MIVNKIVITGKLKHITDNGLKIRTQCTAVLTVNDGEQDFDMEVQCTDYELAKFMVYSTQIGDELTVVGILTGINKIYALSVITTEDKVCPSYDKHIALIQRDKILKMDYDLENNLEPVIDPEGIWL